MPEGVEVHSMASAKETEQEEEEEREEDPVVEVEAVKQGKDTHFNFEICFIRSHVKYSVVFSKESNGHENNY